MKSTVLQPLDASAESCFASELSASVLLGVVIKALALKISTIISARVSVGAKGRTAEQGTQIVSIFNHIYGNFGGIRVYRGFFRYYMVF